MELLEIRNVSTNILPLLAAGQIDQNFSKQFEIPKNIQLQGMLPKEQMNEFYRKANFLVFASRSYEGAPMVFFEAMQHRLPVIAPRLGAYPEMIENGFNGLLFNPGDPEDLADKIKILSSNQDLCRRLGENGYRKLAEKYSPEIYYQQLISIYNELQDRLKIDKSIHAEA